MSNFTFNIAKGRIAHYASLPAANDALILVLLQSTGLQVDATLKDYDNLSVLLAAANDEMTFTGWTRRTLSSVGITTDDTNERVDLTAANPTGWTNTGTVQESGKAIICYDPDTTGGTDADLIPLTAYDCVLTFNTGAAVSVTFDPAGIARIID
jgi:hypothetical protein